MLLRLRVPNELSDLAPILYLTVSILVEIITLLIYHSYFTMMFIRKTDCRNRQGL